MTKWLLDGMYLNFVANRNLSTGDDASHDPQAALGGLLRLSLDHLETSTARPGNADLNDRQAEFEACANDEGQPDRVQR